MKIFLVYFVFSCLFSLSLQVRTCPFHSTKAFDKLPRLHPHPKVDKIERGGVPDSPLVTANKFMLSTYPVARESLLNKTVELDPIIFNSGKLTLVIPEGVNIKEQHEVDWIPKKYDDLKMVAHTSLALYSLIEPIVFKKDPAQIQTVENTTLDSITTYLGMLDNIVASLDTCCNFTPKELARQKQIVSKVQTFLEGIASSKTVSGNQLSKLAESIASMLVENINEAARYGLDSLHEKVTHWRKNVLTKEQWDKLRVIIMAPHMPRNGELSLQYFSRLLRTPENSDLRVMYAEGLWTFEEALGLLGTHVTDFEIGDLFWDDPEFMHSDVLSTEARDYLPKLIPCDPGFTGPDCTTKVSAAQILSFGMISFALSLLLACIF